MTPAFPAPEAEAPETDAPASLSERLRSYARFAALIADQVEALEQRDGVRLRELGGERAALEDELRDEAGELPDLLGEAVQAVEDHLAEHEALRSRWTSLEAGALRATRAVGLRRAAQGRYPTPALPDTRLDVRF